MRVTLLFLAALLFPISALAQDTALIDYCLTTADPRSCLASLLADQQASQQRFQRDMQAAQLQNQLEQARIQANGMALFGAGNALINGTNQGFQNMQQPYVNTPYFSYGPQRK